MTRVKRGKIKHKKREKLLTQTKGFRWGRKSKKRQAKEALIHKLEHAFRGRKEKKRVQRRLWIVKINAGARLYNMKYSTLISFLAKKQVKINRKMLADLAQNEPKIFEKIVELAKS